MKISRMLGILSVIGMVGVAASGCTYVQKGAAAGGLVGGVAGNIVGNNYASTIGPATGTAMGVGAGAAVGGLAGDAYAVVTEEDRQRERDNMGGE
ncbi:MAG: hypothetical protein JJU11_07245 [Candidatus Sumerlaeia bacterium]|nr:hypothetical protein [Candidatus Sumerlaeia bacterium]